MPFTELAVLLFPVSDPFGRRVAGWLKPTGLKAIERFMGLLLCLLAVNMTLYGIKLYFAV